jgi:hypothetical protein
MADTRKQWLQELERLGPLMAGYNLSATLKDAVYVDRPAGQKPHFRDADAFNFSSSDAHNRLVVDAVAALQGRMPPRAIRVLLGELTDRKTYGAFSELMAYKWLGDAGLVFTAQVPMASADVLNPNGSTIDGTMVPAGGKTVAFDVKGFGFIEHKIKLLRERLQEEFPGNSVLIEGGHDISIGALQDLNERPAYPALVADLRASGHTVRERLHFRVQDPRSVTVTVNDADPLALAAANRDYPLRFASQYTRNLPFLLVFVIHPWFSQGMIHQNFQGFVDRFTRELSRFAFFSFEHDATPVEGMPRSQATTLLSGLVFLHAWPATGTDAPRPRPFCRVFLNPHAAHPLTIADLAAFKTAFGSEIVIEVVSAT